MRARSRCSTPSGASMAGHEELFAGQAAGGDRPAGAVFGVGDRGEVQVPVADRQGPADQVLRCGGADRSYGIHVAQLIVPGAIEPGHPRKDPAVLAEKLWDLHTKRDTFRVQVSED